MNIANTQMVGVQGDKINILLPQTQMTKQEALVHAAWLVMLADINDEFNEVLDEIRNT